MAGCNLLGHHLHVSLGNLVHQLLLHNNVDLADVLGELGRHRPFHGLPWKKESVRREGAGLDMLVELTICQRNRNI